MLLSASGISLELSERNWIFPMFLHTAESAAWAAEARPPSGVIVRQLVDRAAEEQGHAHAPALRRLDTLLVVAPAWAGLIALKGNHAP